MNKIAGKNVDKVSVYLIQLCHELGVFPDSVQCDAFEDLIDSGLIDSMGLMYIQEIIHDKFGLEIGTELFIAELRNIRSIAIYLVQQLPAQELEKKMLTI